MVDVFSQEKRSEIMARVKGHGNKATEQRVTEIFREHSITGWRRHYSLFGKPDFVFRKKRLAVFVDGCFWHSCPKHGSQPVNNLDFWQAKLLRNKRRDRLVNKTLKDQGWCVLRVWQHELLRKNEGSLLRRIERAGLKAEDRKDRWTNPRRIRVSIRSQALEKQSTTTESH
jgi:DNA mismatch endonuclease (patch repair protein)